ncbi:hypothetical protein KY314_01395 [Candidatus Woesearchaeota archaeon]|nr:hypothetical protein [Candidatus Woesearchaeota archaeon]
MANYTDEQIRKAMKDFASLEVLRENYLLACTLPKRDTSIMYRKYEEARKTFLNENPEGIIALVKAELDLKQEKVEQTREVALKYNG